MKFLTIPPCLKGTHMMGGAGDKFATASVWKLEDFGSLLHTLYRL